MVTSSTPHSSLDATLRVASWNINAASDSRFRRQLRFLLQHKIDLALLQEVHISRNRAEVARSEGWTYSFSSHDVADDRTGSRQARHELGAMILVGPALQQLGAPERLPSVAGIVVPAPERSITIRLGSCGAELTAASLYSVTGDARSSSYGPDAKSETNRSWAAWMTSQSESTVVGMDANSPREDLPEESENVYWGSEADGFQSEPLIFDRRRAPHHLRDAYRRFLEEGGSRPTASPLAISHFNRGRPRRYDFLFVTPDIAVDGASYASELIGPSVPRPALSDHAPVIAELRLRPAR